MKKKTCLVIMLTMIIGMVSSCSSKESSPTKKQKMKKSSETEVTDKPTESEKELEEKTTGISSTTSTTTSTTEETTVATSASVQESNSALFSGRAQRNEFNEKTNQTIVVGTYEFSVPLYWIMETTEDYGWYGYVDTTSESFIEINTFQYENEGVYSDLEEDVKTGEMARIISDSYDRIGDLEPRAYENGGIKGFVYAFDFTQNGRDGYCILLMFASENDKEYYIVRLMQDESDEYQYTDDFMKILNHIRKVEKRITPTPTPEPTPTPTSKPTNTPTPTPTPKPKKHRYEYAYKWYNPNTYTTVYWLFDTDNKAFLMQLNSSSVGDGGFYKGTFKNGKTITLTFYYEGEPEELPPGENQWRVTIHDSYISVQTNVGSPSEFTKIDVSEVDYLLGDAAFD